MAKTPTTAKKTAMAQPKAARSAAPRAPTVPKAAKPAPKGAKPVAKVAAKRPAPAPEPKPAPSQHLVRRKDLIEELVTKTGLKRRDVRIVLDATLECVGDHLSAGSSMALPPLGRLRVHRTRETDDGAMLTCKLRRRKPQPSQTPEDDPLATAAE